MKVEAIRRNFPAPRKITFRNIWHDDDSYCIGGAICYTAADSCVESIRPFPLPRRLAKALRKLNPLLPPKQSRKYARTIMHANDRSEFEFAWRTVGMALDYQGEIRMSQIGEWEKEIIVPEPLTVPEKFPEPVKEPAPVERPKEPVHS